MGEDILKQCRRTAGSMKARRAVNHAAKQGLLSSSVSDEGEEIELHPLDVELPRGWALYYNELDNQPKMVLRFSEDDEEVMIECICQLVEFFEDGMGPWNPNPWSPNPPPPNGPSSVPRHNGPEISRGRRPLSPCVSRSGCF